MTGWHLDKRIPIAFLLLIAVQSGAAIWWAADQSARMKAVEAWIADNRAITERLSRIETRQEYVIQTIERIDRKLEKKE